MLPAGIVTFLFTDVHDSTLLWEQDPVAMRAATAEHDALVRGILEGHDGMVVKSTGDGFMAVFDDAEQGIAAAIGIQRAVAGRSWPVPIGIRIGVHTGAAQPVGDDYHAPAVNRAARIAGAAHPGQILVSAPTAALGERFAFLDLGAHRLKGLPPIGLHQVLADGLRSDFPALATSASTRVQLPVPMTTFVGREAEVDELCRLVREHRVVTLTGVGGCGKTRLAIEVATRLGPSFADGARFVDLASVTDDARALDSVAAALGLVDPSVDDPLHRLASFLSQREFVIVLDNCEHLLDVSADVAEAVGARGGATRILATSRENLSVAGEQVHSVRSLAPESEALRLFADRAALVREGFAATDENRAVITQVCRRLDGIPLAVELAAAQVAQLSVDQILERLDDRFRLLVGGRRRVQRQHTLAAALDWSHEMLAVDEQQALRRLAVFPGSFSLEAAQHVVGGSDAVTFLRALVSKSLVDVLDEGERFRYRLLETVRLYAEQHLVAAGEAEQTRQRQCEWIIGWLDATPLEERWFGDHDWLQDELANVRAALDWSAVRGDPVAIARIASGVDWTRSEFQSEGAKWCEYAFASEELPPGLRQQVVAMWTVLLTVSFEDRAREVAAITVDDVWPSGCEAVALVWLSAIRSVRAAADGDRKLAEVVRALAHRAVLLSDQFAVPWQIYCRFVAGMTYGSLGTVWPVDLESAKALFEEALERAPRDSFASLRATLYEYLALFRLLEELPVEALALAQHAPSGLGYWPLFGPNRSAARILALAANDDLERSGTELRELFEVFGRRDVPYGRETVCMYAGAVAAIVGDWERAAQLLAAGRPGMRAGAEAALVYYRYRDLVRNQLSPEAGRALRRDGHEMDIDDAIEMALGPAGLAEGRDPGKDGPRGLARPNRGKSV